MPNTSPPVPNTSAVLAATTASFERKGLIKGLISGAIWVGIKFSGGMTTVSCATGIERGTGTGNGEISPVFESLGLGSCFSSGNCNSSARRGSCLVFSGAILMFWIVALGFSEIHPFCTAQVKNIRMAESRRLIVAGGIWPEACDCR
jgi:hypothetical protein